jgi:predicted PurR-regulated permease PerM
MNEPIIPTPPRESILRHRHERNWQILTPIIIVSIVGIILGILIIYGTIHGGDSATWAAIATILLVVPIMVVSFLLLVVLSLLIYESQMLYKVLPTYSGQAQDTVLNVTAQVSHYSEKSTEPILMIKTWLSVPGKVFHKK